VKVGDLVRMKEEPFPLSPYGLGLLMAVSLRSRGCNCKVFFRGIVSVDFDGYKYCNNNDLEIVSESR